MSREGKGAGESIGGSPGEVRVEVIGRGLDHVVLGDCWAPGTDNLGGVLLSTRGRERGTVRGTAVGVA